MEAERRPKPPIETGIEACKREDSLSGQPMVSSRERRIRSSNSEIMAGCRVQSGAPCKEVAVVCFQRRSRQAGKQAEEEEPISDIVSYQQAIPACCPVLQC